jgi:hypothetical protein
MARNDSATSADDGILRFQPNGRWAVCWVGSGPAEITSGKMFRIEVPGKEGLHLTRMEHMLGEGYYSVHGHKLRDGLRAAIGESD